MGEALHTHRDNPDWGDPDRATASRRWPRVLLRELAGTMALDFHRNFLGQSVDVLVEQVKNNTATGYSKRYIPVEFTTREDLRGQVVSVRATEAGNIGLTGKL